MYAKAKKQRIRKHSSSPGFAQLQVASNICVSAGFDFGGGITVGGIGRKAFRYRMFPPPLRKSSKVVENGSEMLVKVT